MKRFDTPFSATRHLDLWSVAAFGFWSSTFGGGNSFSESVANVATPNDGQRYDSGTLRDDTAAEKAQAAANTAAAVEAMNAVQNDDSNARRKVNTTSIETADGSSLELTQEDIKKFITDDNFTDIDAILEAAVDSTVVERKAYNDSIDGILDFDSWLKQGSSDDWDAGPNTSLIPDAGVEYLNQHTAYKDYVNVLLRDRPEWMTSDDKDYGRKSFKDFNPGITLVANTNALAKSGAGEEIVGYYRNYDEAKAKYADIMDTKLRGFGYDHLITDNMGWEDYQGAYETYNHSRGFIDQISALGYGDLVSNKTSFSNLEKVYGEVTERDRYKNLLDDMGYEYDSNDDSTGLSLMYGQAQAIEDTKSKLEAAKSAYSGLEGTYSSSVNDMADLQGEFDTLFGDYGSLTTNYGDLQGTYDTLTGTYKDLEGLQGKTKTDLDAKAGEYDALSGLYDNLTSNYGTMTTDYNNAIGSLSDLQGNYDNLDKDRTTLQGTYDDLFGDYGNLTGQYDQLGADNTALQGSYNALTGQYDQLGSDYGTLTDDFDALTNTQTRTLEDLEAERGAATGLRGEMRGNQSAKFLAANEADRSRRIGSGVGQIQAPTQPQYTAAMGALGGSALDPGPYKMDPIDFTGGFDASIFEPTAMGGLADLGAYGTTDYTDIFAGPQMGMSTGGFDLNQSFNPYYEALNQQYGVNIPSTNYGLPPLGGQK